MRLTFEISDELHKTLSTYIPHGMRKHVYSAVMQGLGEELKRDQQATLFAIFKGTLDYRKLVEGATQEEDS